MVTKGLILYSIVAYTLHVGFGASTISAIVIASVVTIVGAGIDALQKYQENK